MNIGVQYIDNSVQDTGARAANVYGVVDAIPKHGYLVLSNLVHRDHACKP